MTISDYDVSIRQSYQLSAQAQLIAADKDFSREGYVISAWTENADGSGKQYAPEAVLQADEVSADIQLWAQWKKLTISYRYPVYNTTSDPASGIKEWKTGQLSDGEYTLVKSSDQTWNEGWHVVEGEVTIGRRVQCEGNVRLVLTDGCKLTVTGGIDVDASDTLAIYGQDNSTGKLITYGLREDYDYENSPAIGVSYGTNGSITINGGVVTANGTRYTAGIGGGWEYGGGDGSNITINGGIVTAKAGEFAGAGIGGGGAMYGATPGNCSNVIVNGGTVSAFGGVTSSSAGTFFADGIGAGTSEDRTKGSVSNIRVSTSLNINGGTIPNDGGDLAPLLHGVTTVSITPKSSN